jgi:hypothetical protein
VAQVEVHAWAQRYIINPDETEFPIEGSSRSTTSQQNLTMSNPAMSNPGHASTKVPVAIDMARGVNSAQRSLPRDALKN